MKDILVRGFLWSEQRIRELATGAGYDGGSEGDVIDALCDRVRELEGRNRDISYIAGQNYSRAVGLADELDALREAVRELFSECFYDAEHGYEWGYIEGITLKEKKPQLYNKLMSLALNEGGGGESRGLCQPESAHRPVALRLLVREGVWYVQDSLDTLWPVENDENNPALWAACEAYRVKGEFIKCGETYKVDVDDTTAKIQPADGRYTATPETCVECPMYYSPITGERYTPTGDCPYCHGTGYTYTITRDGEE